MARLRQSKGAGNRLLRYGTFWCERWRPNAPGNDGQHAAAMLLLLHLQLVGRQRGTQITFVISVRQCVEREITLLGALAQNWCALTVGPVVPKNN